MSLHHLLSIFEPIPSIRKRSRVVAAKLGSHVSTASKLTDEALPVRGRRCASLKAGYALAVLLLLFFPWIERSRAQTGMTVALCSKTDPNDKIEGIAVEFTSDHWTILAKNRRVTIYGAEFEVCNAPASENPPKSSSAVSRDPAFSKSPVEAPAQLLPPKLSPQGPVETLVLQGSGTVGVGAFPYLLEGYANFAGATLKKNPAEDFALRHYELTKNGDTKPFLSIIVKATGSNTALSSLVDKRAQIGMSSRPFLDEEIETLKRLHGGPATREDVERVIGLDGILIIANKSNPVSVIGLCDAARLFSKPDADWAASGGRPGLVHAHVLTPSSGTFDLFTSKLLGACGASLSKTAIPHNNWPDLVAAVAADRDAVGFVGTSVPSDSVKRLDLRGTCGLESPPTRFNIKTEDYPLSRRLLLLTPYTLDRNSQALIDWALSSDTAQAALADGEAIDQRIVAEDNSDRLQQGSKLPENSDRAFSEFKRDTSNGKRLAITYRFLSGSSTLDTKAYQDISRLVRYFEAAPSPPTVLIAGFADSNGNASANRLLSQQRADAVRQTLLKTGARLNVKQILSKGYGQVLPVACNDTTLGRERNRRVEVFLLP